MGVVSVPGMSIERSVLRRRGLIAVAVIIVVLLVGWLVRAVWPKDEFSFTLRSPAVAAGIVDGAPVRIQGVQVGQVTDVKHVANGQQGVTVTVNSRDGKSLTNNVEAAYSAGNLFGVSEVILTPHDGGGELKDGALITPTKTITDNTVSNMIVTIGDVNSEAIRPHASEILMNFDASSKALLPLFTALGSVAQAVQDTQKLPVSKTFPELTAALQSADSATAVMIPGFRTAFNYGPVHDTDWYDRGLATLDAITNKRDSLTAGLQQILSPQAIGGLKTGTPLLVNLMLPILNAFPNGSATGVGIQIGQLLDNVRKAMPNTPNGPVLNLRVSVDFPAIGAMLPPLPEVQYIPPKPGQGSTAAKPSQTQKPSAASSSAPTTKPGS